MPSVTSLDQDMRKLRLDRYTPGAAREVRSWIEATLGEALPPGDLMDALKDGVALCKLVNLAVSPGVKYKQSNMPFAQMENISHFLKACEMPPLNLPSHDRFLTVDLYESKDPTQVLQCIAAFSRRANTLKPSSFPETIGAKSKGSSMSPQGTGSSPGTRSPGYTTTTPTPSRERGSSNTSDSHPLTFNPLNKAAYSGRISPSKGILNRGGLAAGGPVSSWSSKGDVNSTAPAWNIHQYGYMGGASQGNQGISFGSRRQITSTAPDVPSIAEKEKRLKEKLEQERREIEEQERLQEVEREAEEQKARVEEQQRWEQETRKRREREDLERRREGERRQQMESEAAERKAAEEEERERERQKEQEDHLRRERERERERELEHQRRKEKELGRESQMAKERSRQRTTSDARLNGQFLSQYQADQVRTATTISQAPSNAETAESRRIAELERQLEEMKAQQRQTAAAAPRTASPQPPSLPNRPIQAPQTSHEEDWNTSERDYLRKEWQTAQDSSPAAPPKPPRPNPAEPALPSRPLPDPTTYTTPQNRTDRFLSSNPAPQTARPSSHHPQDYSSTTEAEQETRRREASQQKTKAGGWASKSLLEREMERERERQREWEEGQKASAAVARDHQQGSAPGQSWDVHQYGYVGGDSQNRGGPGLGVGGARRQIIGPRPPP